MPACLEPSFLPTTLPAYVIYNHLHIHWDIKFELR